MKIEVDLKELLELIEKSAEVTKERLAMLIPSDEVSKECYEAYTKGRKFGFTRGAETVIEEIRKVTGIMEEGQ